MRYTIDIIILYCVNCKYSILSAPPCGNHMLLLSVLYIVILCTRPVSTHIHLFPSLGRGGSWREERESGASSQKRQAIEELNEGS